MPALPTGTVTFLFTDIEGSTRLIQDVDESISYRVFADHRRLLVEAVETGGGNVYQDQGESFVFVFPRAKDAVRAAVAAQRALGAHSWPDERQPKVRMGLHTGEPMSGETGLVGVDIHRAARICAAGHGGQILLSEATRALVVEDLPDETTLRELGEHRLKDLARPERLFQIVAAGLLTHFPALKSLDAHPHNLPVQPTPLIGRGREVAAVSDLLRRDAVRILTLTGAGGIGKTRLALQVAAEVFALFEDGIFFVPLAAIADPTLVMVAVAQSLGLRESAGRSLHDILKDYLEQRRLLLVLDNFEQVVDAVPAMAEVLAVCPRLKLLVTSRVRLRIQGEHEFSVPPLTLPDRTKPFSVQSGMQYEAVRLFVERARALKSDFMITEENAAAIASICHRLDGLPLAIELTAARAKLFSPQGMLSRLEKPMKFLTAGMRDLPARQQTLRGTISWSYDLLDEGEKTLFRRLAVFAGGCTADAAEAVCDGDLPVDVVDGLASLVDKSLLRQEEHRSGEVRFVMLETIREYALEQLQASGKAEALRSQHLDYFLRLAESHVPTTGFGRDAGPDLEPWLRRVEAEHDNMRAALEWSQSANEPEVTLRLATALVPFWNVRGYFIERRKWLDLEATLAAASALPPALRARALLATVPSMYLVGDIDRAVGLLEESATLYRDLGDSAGRATALDSLAAMVYRQGNYGRAAALLDEGLSLCRASGNRAEMAFALYLRGMVARVRGQYEEAEALGTEALILCREIGLQRRAAFVRDHLGLVARHQGQYDRAKALSEEALAIARELGDKYMVAAALNTLGLIACGQRDETRAAAACEESLALARQMGDKGAAARALNILGRVALARGDGKQADRLHYEALSLFRELGDRLGVVQVLERLATISAARGDGTRAARLFAQAEVLREAIGSPLPPVDRAEHEELIASVRSHLGGDASATAWAEGRAMTLEQAIEYALKDDRGTAEP